MGQIDAGTWGVIVTIIVAAIGGTWTLSKYIGGKFDAVNSRVDTVDHEFDIKLTGVNKEFALRLESAQSEERTARHKDNGNIMQMLGQQKTDFQRQYDKLDTKVDRIEQDMVRKPDLAAMESRITAQFDKLERKFDASGLEARRT